MTLLLVKIVRVGTTNLPAATVPASAVVAPDKLSMCGTRSLYYARFGGLLNAYRRLGYNTPEMSGQATMRQRKMLVRNDLIRGLLEAFPNQIVEVRKSRGRALLRYRRTRLLITVVLAQPHRDSGESVWRLEAPKSKKKRTAVVAFLTEDNAAIQSLRVFYRRGYSRLTIRVRRDNDWLRSGLALGDTSEFIRVLDRVRCSQVVDH